jgi:hypothetical protein
MRVIATLHEKPYEQELLELSAFLETGKHRRKLSLIVGCVEKVPEVLNAFEAACSSAVDSIVREREPPRLLKELSQREQGA